MYLMYTSIPNLSYILQLFLLLCFLFQADSSTLTLDKKKWLTIGTILFLSCLSRLQSFTCNRKAWDCSPLHSQVFHSIAFQERHPNCFGIIPEDFGDFPNKLISFNKCRENFLRWIPIYGFSSR